MSDFEDIQVKLNGVTVNRITSVKYKKPRGTCTIDVTEDIANKIYPGIIITLIDTGIPDADGKYILVKSDGNTMHLEPCD